MASMLRVGLTALVGLVAYATAVLAQASTPAPQEGVWIAKDFKFSTGETMPEVKLA